MDGEHSYAILCMASLLSTFTPKSGCDLVIADLSLLFAELLKLSCQNLSCLYLPVQSLGEEAALGAARAGCAHWYYCFPAPTMQVPR